MPLNLRARSVLTALAALTTIVGCIPAAPTQPASQMAQPPNPTPILVEQRAVTIVVDSQSAKGAIDLTRSRAVHGSAPTGGSTSTGSILTSDAVLDWRFHLTPLDLAGVAGELTIHGLAFEVRNRSRATLEIDWDRSVVVDSQNQVRRILHRAVKLADRSASSPPGVVPPQAMVSDFVFPLDNTHYHPGRFGGWSATPFFEALEVGDEIGLSLALRLDETSFRKTFRFRVASRELQPSAVAPERIVTAPRYRVVRPMANVFAEPSMESKVVQEVARDTHVEALQEWTGDWLKVRTPDGREGWMHSAVLYLYSN
jgi:hypothetical protein